MRHLTFENFIIGLFDIRHPVARLLVLGQSHHSYYKDLVRKPGKVQRSKQRSKDLCWKVHDPAQSFVLYSHPLAELRNRHVSIG